MGHHEGRSSESLTDESSFEYEAQPDQRPADEAAWFALRPNEEERMEFGVPVMAIEPHFGGPAREEAMRAVDDYLIEEQKRERLEAEERFWDRFDKEEEVVEEQDAEEDGEEENEK